MAENIHRLRIRINEFIHKIKSINSTNIDDLEESLNESLYMLQVLQANKSKRKASQLLDVIKNVILRMALKLKSQT